MPACPGIRLSAKLPHFQFSGTPMPVSGILLSSTDNLLFWLRDGTAMPVIPPGFTDLLHGFI